MSTGTGKLGEPGGRLRALRIFLIFEINSGGTQNLCVQCKRATCTCTIYSHVGYFLHLLTVPASRNEYQTIRLQLESETFPPENPGDKPKSFHSLPPQEQAQLEKKRLAGELCMSILH